MWVELMTWWCRLFGYATCGELSTFEAIVLAAVALFGAYIILAVTLGLIGAAMAR